MRPNFEGAGEKSDDEIDYKATFPLRVMGSGSKQCGKFFRPVKNSGPRTDAG